MTAGEQTARTVNPVPRTVQVDVPADRGDVGALLEQVRDVALRMLAEDDRGPGILRVRVGDVALEMEWPEQQPTVGGPVDVTMVGQAAASEQPGDGDGEPSAGYLTAHTVGCFYRRPSPDAAPFVAEGELVSAGRQVAIIEAMKLMLPVEVDQDCRIGAVLATDGQSVEFGDRLFALEAAGHDGDEG